MAARENQGLQIAVMIFFLLVVLLLVTTYVFFKNWDDTLGRVAELKTQASNAITSQNLAQDELNAFKGYMGFSIEDNSETVANAYKEDMANYSVGFEGDNKDYRTLLKHQVDLIKDRDTNIKTLDQGLQGLNDKIAVLETNKDKQITTFQTSMDKISQDAQGERSKFNDERARIKTSADEVAKQLDTKRDEITELLAKNTTQVKKLSTTVTKLSQLNKQKTERLQARESQNYEVPDGHITWVNQREKVVWINLGRDDNLKRQIMFSVYPTDSNNAASATKKGSIEITRIIDRHMAEGRIISDDLSDPILPGDNIHSPVWQRGRRDGFALVGFMDIDGDGVSDRDRVRDLIKFNGGDVDAELTDAGKIKGKLKIGTRYMVLGEPPTEKNQELIDSYSSLTGQAQKLGIETISLVKFLSQMGFQSESRTVQLGSGARSGDFRAKPYEGKRGSTGATSQEFQKRKRPTTTF